MSAFTWRENIISCTSTVVYSLLSTKKRLAASLWRNRSLFICEAAIAIGNGRRLLQHSMLPQRFWNRRSARTQMNKFFIYGKCMCSTRTLGLTSAWTKNWWRKYVNKGTCQSKLLDTFLWTYAIHKWQSLSVQYYFVSSLSILLCTSSAEVFLLFKQTL